MSDDFWRWAGKTINKTQQTMDQARKEAERLAREAQKQLDESGKGAKSAVA